MSYSFCVMCGFIVPPIQEQRPLCCMDCGNFCYCSKKCRDEHALQHRFYCEPLQDLSNQELVGLPPKKLDEVHPYSCLQMSIFLRKNSVPVHTVNDEISTLLWKRQCKYFGPQCKKSPIKKSCVSCKFSHFCDIHITDMTKAETCYIHSTCKMQKKMVEGFATIQKYLRLLKVANLQDFFLEMGLERQIGTISDFPTAWMPSQINLQSVLWQDLFQDSQVPQPSKTELEYLFTSLNSRAYSICHAIRHIYEKDYHEADIFETLSPLYTKTKIIFDIYIWDGVQVTYREPWLDGIELLFHMFQTEKDMDKDLEHIHINYIDVSYQEKHLTTYYQYPSPYYFVMDKVKNKATLCTSCTGKNKKITQQYVYGNSSITHFEKNQCPDGIIIFDFLNMSPVQDWIERILEVLGGGGFLIVTGKDLEVMISLERYFLKYISCVDIVMHVQDNPFKSSVPQMVYRPTKKIKQIIAYGNQFIFACKKAKQDKFDDFFHGQKFSEDYSKESVEVDEISRNKQKTSKKQDENSVKEGNLKSFEKISPKKSQKTNLNEKEKKIPSGKETSPKNKKAGKKQEIMNISKMQKITPKKQKASKQQGINEEDISPKKQQTNKK